MNSPFGRNAGDFRPRPVSAGTAATEQDKLRATPDGKADFRPRPVIAGPKESAPATAPEEVKVEPAHPAAPTEKSKATGESTQPAETQTTQKSSSPETPRTPSKR